MKGKAVVSAKFNSTCAETGRSIAKGEAMVYDYDTKKCYAKGSNTQINVVNGFKVGDKVYLKSDHNVTQVIDDLSKGWHTLWESSYDQGGSMLDESIEQAYERWYAQTYPNE